MSTLRNYKQGDEPGVFAMVEFSLKQYGLSVNPEGTDSDLENINRSYILPGGSFKVIEENGRIIGSCGLYKINTAVCELRKMYLNPEFKGKGLGEKMMIDAFSTAKRLRFSKMILETNSCLVEAVCLYRKYGFTEYKPEHLSDRCDYAMEKHL